MPDWKAIVKAQLPNVTPEVTDELASHLEDYEACLLAEGVLPVEAFERTRRELTNSPALGKRIARAKGHRMNHRSKALWFPGLVSFTASAALLAMCQNIAIHANGYLASMADARSAHWFSGSNIVPYFAWLFCQPLCGALGAWLSKRSGGGKLESISAGLFPSIVMLLMMTLLLPFAVLVERNQYILSHPGPLAVGLVAWVGLPAVSLLVGTVPFWRSSAFEKEAVV